jgi:hypothetical protein
LTIFLTEAYQAGADAELEACCEWLESGTLILAMLICCGVALPLSVPPDAQVCKA